MAMEVFIILGVISLALFVIVTIVALLPTIDSPRDRAEMRARQAEQDIARISRETQDAIIKRAMFRGLNDRRGQ
jgi:hypothetical protein